ncbi:hypothetical protein QR680_004048 [Steinernema hermaphroditum]|uniref:Small ribosomal subunit protein uS5m n=1 Tax=Steinernema hermaphroditum TaxID=289476 RepID=A0AA39HNJ5_9BILA|nr:hypothetical protein QR680_004048 [Steinernema hermaphroditum]
MGLSLIPIIQSRGNTVNFFMRRTGPELWKTLTSVSKSGQKKGRRATRQQVRPLDRFYRIGAGPMNVKFPGLNTPIDMRKDIEAEPMSIVEQNEEEIKASLNRIRTHLEERGTQSKRRPREKLHPLERGFSGTQIVGQRLGPPPPVDDVKFDDFETYCLEVKRTSNMTRVFGRVHTMSALIITGNGRGTAGYAVGKAPIHRTNNAILLEGRTIFQDFYAECRNTRVFAQRRPEGFGLSCHPRLEKICQAIGIKDIYVKVEGSTKNYLALTHAFVTGLLNQETHQQLAERKGLHVVEMKPGRHYLPQIIASPITAELVKDEELPPLDRLKLDDFYGEGRFPWRKPKQLPFWVNTPGHLEAQWKKHPFRNQEKQMHRLLADGDVERWTRESRKKWGERKNELVGAGVEAMPRGIGLSDIVPKPES